MGNSVSRSDDYCASVDQSLRNIERDYGIVLDDKNADPTVRMMTFPILRAHNSEVGGLFIHVRWAHLCNQSCLAAKRHAWVERMHGRGATTRLPNLVLTKPDMSAENRRLLRNLPHNN